MKSKNKAAIELGKLGGKVGGIARALALSPERRNEIAKKAAQARWADNKGQVDLTDIIIEKNVKIPAPSLGTWASLIRSMEIGDSIFFKENRKARAFKAAMHSEGYNYISFRENDGIRIWRVLPKELRNE